ncbi:MAG TPA: hypothetical protein VMT37_15965 [Solirubrobacterales bacterium]|nr:hypothetical protein [Solirubrobacterales bacterium]
MPSYPIEPGKLLETADRLVPAHPGRGRPAYTDHRRALSTAYYAVFHAITDRVTKAAFTEADTAFQRKVQRWIKHGDIRMVSVWVGQMEGTIKGGPPQHIEALLRPGEGVIHIDADTLSIAEGFLDLNEVREQADYDHDAVFTRPQTLSYLAQARSVVATVEGTQTDAAKRFFGLVAMRSNIQAR